MNILLHAIFNGIHWGRKLTLSAYDRLKRSPLKTLFRAMCYLTFWGWNLIFLGFVYFALLPWIIAPLIVGTIDGIIPIDFLISFLGLIAVPTIAFIIGYWKLRKRPLRLMGLFYGVEGPLFLLSFLRLFVIRELTAASGFMLATLFLCIAAFSLELLFGYARRKQSLAWIQLASHAAIFLMGLYVSALLMFYVIPVAAVLLEEFFRFNWLSSLWWELTHYHIGWAIRSLWFIFILGFTSTLFLFMPFAVASLYLRSGQKIIRAFAAQNGWKRAAAGIVAPLIAWSLIFSSFHQQPQVAAFELLEKPAVTDSDRRELLANSDLIRKGLTNAYLSPYRYLSSAERMNNIRVMYRHALGLSDDTSQSLQDTFNWLVSPFLYQGDRSDREKAVKLYEQFFDTPLQRGEQKAVLKAVSSTSDTDEAKAGLFNIGEKKVWLRQQEVNVKEEGDWAEVELYEVYENQTDQVEEILYYFSLPESAVVTGLWLGDTGDRDRRFTFKISPRGAAQKVYNSQVQRARPVDPALLEQVGPGQYRLRAFPVPVKLRTWERGTKVNRPTEMHLWLAYKVMRQPEGWAMPRLAERRNIYWTGKTERTYNGKTVKGLGDEWLPASLPTKNGRALARHEIDLGGGDRIAAVPLLTPKDYSIPVAERFAVVLDSSFSMGSHRQEVQETFDWLKKYGFADYNFANNDADLYLAVAGGGQPGRLDDLSQFDPQAVTYYGSLQYSEMLQQFARLKDNTPYDGIILVTDSGSYELSKNKNDFPKLTAPVWMVHLGGMPAAYDDPTLELLHETGGGVASQISEALTRIATKEDLGPAAVSVADGYAWYLVPGSYEATVGDGFAPLAARQLVLGLSQRMDIDTLEELDAIHRIAKTYKIVTPYSSAIVLVNDEQREALREAEESSDRFDREVEDGKEQLTSPQSEFDPTSTPEPGTVFGLVAIALLVVVARQRRLL
jgi:putative PEP-CTERM system integral membrane protein